MWNESVERHVQGLKQAFARWPEMKKVVAYAEARPSPPMSIQETIRHTFVDYLHIVRDIAHMPPEDIELIRSADSHMGKDGNGVSKGTLAFFEKLGEHRVNLVAMIGNAVHPDSPQYKKTRQRIIHLMNNAQKIPIEDMALPDKDGRPQFDNSIWGYRNIKSVLGQIHATIGHFMSQALFQKVELIGGEHWEKDDLLAAMTDQLIINHLRHPTRPSPIFELWRRKKADGGLGWISDARLQAFQRAVEQ